MIRKIGIVLDAIRNIGKSAYYGFIQGHKSLSSDDLTSIELLVGEESDDIVFQYEHQFAKLIGPGKAFSYAAARMGFYDLMRILDIGQGDEVILQSATCSVMVNAVLRAKATPVFADIDPKTFGSSAQAITGRITPKTKMVVAQHSFGIPCDIVPIADLTKEKGIFLLEDCALTLGSKANGIVVGNFGNAALFSTDHSKPLNTLTGGLIYTCDDDLAQQLQISKEKLPSLSAARKNSLWRRLLIERRNCNPERYGRMGIIDLFEVVRRKWAHSEGDFLSDDFGDSHTSVYPYPSKLPSFLAAVGLREILRWQVIQDERIKLLNELIEVYQDSVSASNLPASYLNKNLDIVPLRFAWFQKDADRINMRLSEFVMVDWIWFRLPIIATNLPLELFGYRYGSSPVSEEIGPLMVNIPCNIPSENRQDLVRRVKNALS